MLAISLVEAKGERAMQRNWLAWLRDGLGVLALFLALLNVAGAQRNRNLQGKVDTAQAALQRGQAFANVNNSLIQLLAKAAAERNDTAIRNLLARNGVTFKLSAAPAGAAATAAVQ
jgi:hypothetical protein